MPHLLIAGSTGSGKSVMINSMIMSILYKSTPDEVRMIMVDPKRVELGMYEGIPHLLTPVITDPKKATNALRNAVLEMERRLRLLAEYGVRNIDQFNKKIRKTAGRAAQPVRRAGADRRKRCKPLPYILILIDELADLMMLEGRNVEESVTRLAQMARAVGMHLVLATQRPSVDVITGLIKANFPARISFRVATRVDSRTVLDVMGAEHLLGKGDMLFLPPGSSRLTRVHGAFVTETEINRVVDFWKQQAKPEYDQSLPDRAAGRRRRRRPRENASTSDQDPMYEEAVRAGAGDGQGVDVHVAAPSAPGLRPRGAHSGHDAARRHHRTAGRQQAARSAEAARLAAGSGRRAVGAVQLKQRETARILRRGTNLRTPESLGAGNARSVSRVLQPSGVSWRSEAPSMDFREELVARVEKLPPEMQERVLRFVASLAARGSTGESGTALRHFSGSLDPGSAREIAQAIEEHCERVDVSEW